MAQAVGPEAEEIHPAAGPGFAETVTVAFGEAETGICGLVRIALAEGHGSALGALFHGAELVAAERTGALDPPTEPTWRALEAGPVRHVIDAPLAAWRVRLGDRFDLAFRALAPPAGYALEGLEGYDQLCRVEGTVRLNGTSAEVRCLGQRGHAWGAPDWERLALLRNVSLWRDDGEAVLLTGVQRADAPGHEGDAVAAFTIAGEDAEPHPVDEARLSTTWDGAGRQRRAGLELWTTEEAEYPRRAAGESVAGTSIDLGTLRLDCAFLEWTMEGRTGIGRYDVLRPAGDAASR